VFVDDAIEHLRRDRVIPDVVRIDDQQRSSPVELQEAVDVESGTCWSIWPTDSEPSSSASVSLLS
jgi:hypothetical protein